MKIVIATRPLRNPLVAPSLRRHAGRHQPFGNAARQAERRQLRHELRQLTPCKPSP